MSLEECEAAYLRLSEKIFTPKRSRLSLGRATDKFLVNGKFDYKVLEQGIKDIISGTTGGNEFMLMRDPNPDAKCNV